MTRRITASMALSAAVLLAALLGAAPAQAVDEIGLSPDGVVWYDELHRPLFAPERRWVPGDAETASFYVRNEGTSAARLTIELRSADRADLLAREDIEITARTAGGEWLAVENGVASASLTDRAIDQGGQVRVDVKVRFVWFAPNGTMLERLPLEFEVRLAQAGPSDGDDDGRTGVLPDTGSAMSRVIVWLGAILLGSGIALVLAARRRRAEESADEDAEALVVDEGVRVDG